MKRPGYYVEGRFYAANAAQAQARAQFLADEYSRPVTVYLIEFDGTTTREFGTAMPGTAVPGTQQVA